VLLSVTAAAALVAAEQCCTQRAKVSSCTQCTTSNAKKPTVCYETHLERKSSPFLSLPHVPLLEKVEQPLKLLVRFKVESIIVLFYVQTTYSMKQIFELRWNKRHVVASWIESGSQHSKHTYMCSYWRTKKFNLPTCSPDSIECLT
jgi:hypothetical protein